MVSDPSTSGTDARNSSPADYSNSDELQSRPDREVSSSEDAPDSDLDSESDHGSDEIDLALSLAEWSSEFNITHNALRALLAILVSFLPWLPKDPRTLLRTGRVSGIKTVAGGEYYHFGLKNQLIAMFSYVPELLTLDRLDIQVNIDGLPLFKSVNGCFWPILGKVVNAVCPSSKPFVIGLFYGRGKPADAESYLADFVDEVDELSREGFVFQEKLFNVHLSSMVCDAPARAFLKNIKQHSGYSACEKCTTEGDHIDSRMCFPELNVL